MDDIKKEDLEEKGSPSEQTPEEIAATAAKAEEDANQDPLKKELEKVQNKPKYSKVEKLQFTKKRIEEQLKAELGDDYEDDDDADPQDDDSRPMTVGEYKRIQEKKVVSTALNLADEIESPIERELVKHHLENTIKSSGNAQEDLRNARAIVNVLKNKQILEENGRRLAPKEYNSGGSGPAKEVINDDLTPEEIPFTRPPFNMSKAEVIKARK